MIKIIRVAALAAIAFLTLSVGAVLGVGTAAAALPVKGDAFPAGNTLTVSIVDGTANANCAASIKWTIDGVTSTRTKALNLNASGSGTSTFTGLANAVYQASAECPGVTKIENLPMSVRVDNTVPPNQCVQIVHDIASGLGLRGNELAFVMGLARQFCPR